MNLPEYENPPLIEVVVGAQFCPLSKLFAAHIGLLWSRFQKDYPTIQEAPPLAPVVETFDGSNEKIGFEISETPPLPRSWFIDPSGNLLIQVQKDRFLHNWRKVRPDDQYPRYDRVCGSFERHLAVFEEFVSAGDLGPLAFTQYELTYINIIDGSSGGIRPSKVGDVFRDIYWSDKSRALPEPESINTTISFAFPDERIRLHAKARTANRTSTGEGIVRLEITARGMPSNSDSDARRKWFDNAHERIVTAFTDLTVGEMQQSSWRRIK